MSQRKYKSVIFSKGGPFSGSDKSTKTIKGSEGGLYLPYPNEEAW